MRCGPMWVIKAKKSYPETTEQGQFWRATLLDMDSRLRVARGIAKTETLASIIVFQTLKRRGHPAEADQRGARGRRVGKANERDAHSLGRVR